MTKRTFFSGWLNEAPCPEARMLVSEVDVDLACECMSERAAQRIIRALADPRASEQIAGAVELRKVVAANYTDERLREFVSHLRVRHHIAVDWTAAGAPPPPIVAGATRAALLAEADSLLERLKIIYTLSSLRDVQVNRLRWNSLRILAALLVVLAATRVPSVVNWPVDPELDLALNLGVIALFGAIGSVVSIMRRSQKALDLGPINIDPVRQISALRHGASGMLIAAMVGPMLALVLFAVFAGQMIEITGLTPKITECAAGDEKLPECAFSFLGNHFGFAKPIDAAKLAIWAFLAGFAEQLVPDVLDKFSKAAKEAPAQSASPPAASAPPPVPVAAAATPGPAASPAAAAAIARPRKPPAPRTDIDG